MSIPKLPDVLSNSPFSVLDLDLGRWKERALWWPEPHGPIVSKSIGTATHYAVGAGPAGVDVCVGRCRRRRLKPFLPEHLLVGDGAMVHGSNSAAALLDVLNRSCRDLPPLFWKGPAMIRSMKGRS